VSVSKTGENTYAITIPEFMVIGYSEPNFEVAVDDGGILGWVSPDIDKFEMVNAVFNDAAQVAYLEQHEDELEDQAKVFYDTPDHEHRPGRHHHVRVRGLGREQFGGRRWAIGIPHLGEDVRDDWPDQPQSVLHGRNPRCRVTEHHEVVGDHPPCGISPPQGVRESQRHQPALPVAPLWLVPQNEQRPVRRLPADREDPLSAGSGSPNDAHTWPR
jgi:hypothetical protein